MKKSYLALVALIIVLVGGYFLVRDKTFEPTHQENIIELSEEEAMNLGGFGHEAGIEVVAENLQIPWEVAFLPNGDMLVTERTGSLVRIPSTSSGQVGKNRVKIPVGGVQHRGEGGLLGLALHPNFTQNGWIYLYLTTAEGGGLTNRVERYRFSGDQLFDRKVILENIPGAAFHDGGRIEFGPDGHLYITTGDAGNTANSQNINSLAGKILRVTDEGEIPGRDSRQLGPISISDYVYSYGHRNPQGLAWDNTSQLWATEHGRSGARSGFDEVNKIVENGNYGWPNIQGGETAPGMIVPAAHSGPDITWAPAGAVWWDGSIFFTGLRGQSLYEAVLRGGAVTEIKTHLFGQFGRLRAVQIGPDGMFYVSTSNTDGRGDRRAGDDKIIRINPLIFR